MKYEHTQHGKLHYLLYLTTLVLIAFGVAIRNDHFGVFVIFLGAVFCLLFGVSFHTLTVKDAGDHLRIFTGPLPLFKKKIKYSEISSAEITKSSLIDGWGIHYWFGRGWIINIWGFDCVALRLDKKKFRIGTDDPQGLYRFLKDRINEENT